MDPTTGTPAELLRAEVRADASRPFVTFYDDATGERVELSTATFDNWVAKTAGLLSDGLNVDAGERVALLLPPHWQSLAWAVACWSVGACVVAAPADDVQVAVAGPDTLGVAAETGAAATVALSLRPLGGRFVDNLPADVLDYAVEVPGYPDRFVPLMPPSPDEPALDRGHDVHTLGGLLDLAYDRANQLGVEPGARIFVSTDDLGTALLDALLLPLVVGGSTVLVRHEAEAGRSARLDAERVTNLAHP